MKVYNLVYFNGQPNNNPIFRLVVADTLEDAKNKADLFLAQQIGNLDRWGVVAFDSIEIPIEPKPARGLDSYIECLQLAKHSFATTTKERGAVDRIIKRIKTKYEKDTAK